MKKFFLFNIFICFILLIVACDKPKSTTVNPTTSQTTQTTITTTSTTKTSTTTTTTTKPHSHTPSKEISYDETYHWYDCDGCEELLDKELHNFDDGVVISKPSTIKYGEKLFTCDCGYSYTEQIDKLEQPVEEREIVVDYENQTIYVPTERNLRVAQFADLHIKRGYNFESIDCSNDKLDRTYAFIDQIIAETDPDLIVCSGDNILNTGIKGLEEFVNLMESYQIPWVYMFGNHDAESSNVGYRKSDYASYLLTAETEYLIFANDYTEYFSSSYKDERLGNFVLKTRDLDTEELLGGYIFLDAGYYDSSKSDYQSLTRGQMNWYSRKITELQSEFTGKGVVPSIVFSHIQLPEFYYGYIDAKENKNNTEFVTFQDLSTVDWDMPSIKSILNNSPKKDEGFFDLMKNLGSTKAFFVGHAHNLWYQIKKEGILLGFGPQTGFSVGFETNYFARKSYVYNIDYTFNITTTSVDEPEDLPEGLSCKYFDSANGDYLIENDTYDPETNTYTLKVLFKKYSARSIFLFNGEELDADEITVTGDVVATSAEKTSNELYVNYFSSILIYSWEGSATYIITYNPTTKVLNVKGPEKIEKEDNSGFVVTTTDTNEVKQTIQSVNGNYYVDITLTQPNSSVLFRFNGITLTADNTTFKGVYINQESSDSTNKLYWNKDINGQLLSGTGGRYTFIYEPSLRILSIATPDDGLFTSVNNNKDSVLSVWTNTGKEIKTETSWIGNGWRVYVVVDANGKICYGVVNPVSGYGGAMASSYFRHSDYSDYLSNPAFSYISEPYQGQWGMTVDYKVAVPEGGFVITAYDDSKVELLKHILGLSDVSPANANKQTNNVDNVRISYDESTGIIKIDK